MKSEITIQPLKSPFPWFGGKSRAADLIWPRFGYVEPFAGSLAVLLRRPHEPSNEIVNDIDCYVANAWRAVKEASDEVATYCDWPVNDADLHARHRWLHGRLEFRERMEHDWSRVLTKASTYGQGLTAVLLDPPYDTEGHDDVYGDFSRGVSSKVFEWAIANGQNPLLRIALCGYEGEHEMPSDWDCVAWKAMGGYASAAGNNENSKRERIWFSPHCIGKEKELF